MSVGRSLSRVLLVVALVVTTVALSPTSQAEAQDASPYVFPDRVLGDAAAADTPCPAGLTVIYKVTFTCQ